MSVSAAARDMRYHLRSVMDAVERGEDVYITNRGVKKAKIVPLKSGAETKVSDNPFVGVWKDRDDMQNVAEYVRRIRKGRFS